MSLRETVKMVGALMEVAARTAPKAAGEDYIETKLLSDSEKITLGNDMILIGKERGVFGFERDGRNVLDCDAVLLIGLLPRPRRSRRRSRPKATSRGPTASFVPSTSASPLARPSRLRLSSTSITG